MDLNPLFVQADPGKNKRYCEQQIINEVPDTLDQKIWPDLEKDIEDKKQIKKEFTIQNTNRAVGTRISYQLYKIYGEDKIKPESIQLNFKGSAGQSFGAFAIKGLKLLLKGDANDYVAKGLSGTTISFNLNVGSGPITVLADLSTRLPIRLFLTCPSFPDILFLIHFIGRPFVCFDFS